MSLRLFTAIRVPEEAADRLIPLQKGVPGAKWRPAENLHITLSFFGDVNERDAYELDHCLGDIELEPFELTLKGAGYFGGADPHALWVGVEENEALNTLKRATDKAARHAQLPVEKRAFKPHVTLAYLGATELQRVMRFVQRLNLFELPPFIVESFELYSSRQTKYGPNRYEEEAVYPLRY